MADAGNDDRAQVLHGHCITSGEIETKKHNLVPFSLCLLLSLLLAAAAVFMCFTKSRA